MATFKTYLLLIRPANVITSVADIIAGIAIAGYFLSPPANAIAPVLLLCFSTACLYAGGIVFNDVFDYETDKIERMERPLPQKKISLKEAALLASTLLVAGIVLASVYSMRSGIIAAAIAAAALLYDKFGKHQKWLGPLNMGVCRGLNLLLGISIIPAALSHWMYVAVVPVVYIYSITMISRGEVRGGSRQPLYAAIVLYLLVISTIVVLSYGRDQFFTTILFLVLFSFIIFRPLIQAIKTPIGKNIGRAVKAGVIALILMDAAWAAAFDAVYIALAISLLLPVSLWLSRFFSVT